MNLTAVSVSRREWVACSTLLKQAAEKLVAYRDAENAVVDDERKRFNLVIQVCEREGQILVWSDLNESAHEVMSWLAIHSKALGGYSTMKIGSPLRRYAEGGRLVSTVELTQGRLFLSSLQEESRAYSLTPPSNKPSI
jgi:hypothetical protein